MGHWNGFRIISIGLVDLLLSAITGIGDKYAALLIVFWWAIVRVAGRHVATFPCPRCEERFGATRSYHNPFARKCVHCGLPKGAAVTSPTL
jgi:hypothetical protein